jgi:hypothetical protein
VLGYEKVRKLLGKNPGGQVLEIGGGCLRNALYLQESGFRVSVFEVKGVRERFPREYERFERLGGRVYHQLPTRGWFDLAISTFVIETICSPSMRATIVSGVGNLLRPNGCLVLSVRGPSDLVTADNTGRRCADGYVTPGFTFSRSYTRLQLQRFLLQCSFNDIEFLHKPTTKKPELLHALVWKCEQHQ